jgi:tetratricopeptide (TPR) repeat protein
MNEKELGELEAKAKVFWDQKKDGKFDEVISQLKPVCAELPPDSELRKVLSSALLDRGGAKYKMGRDGEALEDFREAAKVDEGNWKAQVNIATLSMQSERWTEAAQAMEKAFQANKELNNNPNMVDKFRQIRLHL